MDIARRDFLQRIGLTAAGIGLNACGASRLSQRTEEFHPQYPQRTKRGKALILNGDQWDFYHMENIVRAERFLLGIGYGSEDITILSAPYEAFPKQKVGYLQNDATEGGFYLPHIEGLATLRNTEVTLERLVGELATDQELFVYITGHGGVDEKKKNSYAQLNEPFARGRYDKLTDQHLSELLQKGKKSYKGVVVFDGCNGEGFAEVVGGENITAITKSAKGQTDSCVYFANEFFHTPFNWGLDDKRNVTLTDALEYTTKALDKGGAKAHITMRGSYNPILVPEVKPSSMLFSVFMPNSPVQSFREPTIDQLAREGKVFLVQDEAMHSRALAEPNAVFYVQADGCGACENLSSFLAERLEEKKKTVPVYVFKNDFEEGKVKNAPDTARLERELGIQITSVPLLLRWESGKIVSGYDSIPVDIYGYGNLPDRYSYMVSRVKIDRMLAR